ncbi:50S ribosomal protein L13 [Candidatus Nomurabacteria bacterium CG10_big_fil_rev_8_21_14_0_10_35_16]|uniref:50S ribosomal protein L13 n=1 Tax=Candidatus Nomurabacteria bacterium CG10_big_fil_rev_8_21_14_0_10_35_16 TaxID=1974731 RepID=A0A2H0TBM1_9BACT|nr:MAG: 50S ribosomal protein L13 [Candidatus Nomurabacteria bacterium CG10_big_fil_rev_8_21_14_0_10_35_16]
MKTNKTTIETKVIDVSGRTLGRVASEVASLLMGKTQTSFQRHIYSGVPVKIINASKLRITNKKLSEIYHTRYSGYPGGLRVLSGHYTKETKGLKELLKLAIFQMLPDNKLRREMMKNLVIED